MKETLTMKDWIFRVALNLFGLFLLSFGAALGIICGLGASPFDVLQVSMTYYLPITIGQASQTIALVFLFYTWYKGVVPGIGTLLNAIFVGVFIDLIFKFGVDTPDTLAFKFIMLFLSIIFAAIGIVLSLKARIGVGTRDSFMEYIVTVSKRNVNFVRSIIEINVFILGALLGGPIGIGSIITAFTLGPMITFVAKIFDYDFNVENHYTLSDNILYLKNKRIKKVHQNKL